MKLSAATGTEHQPGIVACPSCKSDQWKSAKMVVMEGTTNSQGSLKGTIADPGAFSGGLKAFLISDRWFSFDHPIEAEIGLSSASGLVKEIRQLMTSHSSKSPLPIVPVEPLKRTYLIECFDVSPLAIIDAPERECAKTLFQSLLGRMCYRPLPAANASPSALFRSVASWTPTILFDEADTFFKDKPELQGMVNAGYKRGGFVLRSEATGNSFEPKIFSVYCPKSLAGIALEKHLPDSTMSRGVIFNMRRKLRHETVERLRHADPSAFTTIASKLVRFSQDYRDQVGSVRPVLPDELSDRAQDNWEPLLYAGNPCLVSHPQAGRHSAFAHP